MARESLPINTDEKIVSDVPGVPDVDPKRKIPIYPGIVRKGGAPWQFTGLSDLELFPSPTNTPWQTGWMAPRTRRAMMRHAKIGAAMNILKNASVGDGGRCVPCISPYGPDKAEFKRAFEISQFCDNVLRKTGNFYAAARQMMDCTEDGNKVAPIDYEDIQIGKYKGKQGLADIVVWPNDAYEFYRDETGRTTYLKVNTTKTSSSNTNQQTEKNFHRKKFWVTSWRPVNNDPNGTIHLVPAYMPFYRDIQANYEEMSYMAGFSRPSVVIFSVPPPEAGEEIPKPLWWRDGAPVMEPDPDNPGQERQRYGYSTEQNKLLFTDFEAGSIWSLAGGSDVKLLQPAVGGAETFQNMRDANAREMHSTILGTYQLTESSRNVSNSNQNVGEGVAGLAITEGKKVLETSIEADVLPTLVVRNFGKSAIDYIPIVDFGSGESGRVPQIFNSIVGFVNGGAFTKDQYWWWCIKQGLPLFLPDSEPVVVSVKLDPGGADKTSQKAKPNDKSDQKSGGSDAAN